jgi:mono/diheme cytochrome c family protein
MRGVILFLLLTLVLGLIGCQGQTTPTGGGSAAGGNPSAGEALFAQTMIGTLAGCITCHSLQPDLTLIGPSLARIGAEAGSMVPGQSAEEYLRQAIVAPDEYVVSGFGAGIMPGAYGSELSEQQIQDLVAYLLTLR